MSDTRSVEETFSSFTLEGVWYAHGPHHRVRGSITIEDGKVVSIPGYQSPEWKNSNKRLHLDLSGFLVMPGLINAHDHLQFALFPRLGNPPYRNYIDWGEDIHMAFADVIEQHRSVPKEVRLWWGGIRNLLCGVTTVFHHDPLWPGLRKRRFPVRVLQRYGWAHSPALGGNLSSQYAATPYDQPFFVHACEGVDQLAHRELIDLLRARTLAPNTVIIHGLALDESGIDCIQKHRSSLITCPSSNAFLFDTLPNLNLFSRVDNLALGNDSPLTAIGDLLDEVRFALEHCNLSPSAAYSMVTNAPARILRPRQKKRRPEHPPADLIALCDTGENVATRLKTLSIRDIELVLIGGSVHLASELLVQQLPRQMRHGLEPLQIEGLTRWLRAPVQDLLRRTEEALGIDEIRLGGRRISNPFRSTSHPVRHSPNTISRPIRS